MNSVGIKPLLAVCEDLDSDSKNSFGEKSSTVLERTTSRPENTVKQSQLNAYFTEGIQLSEDFISRPPFLDNNGSSYAFKLVTYEVSPFNERKWVEKHLPFFKVTELSEILKRFHIDQPVFSIIALLTEQEMEYIIRGTNLILAKNFLLVRDQSDLGFSPLRYFVYDRVQVGELLKDSDFEFQIYEPSQICFEKVGIVCWMLNSKKTLSYLYKYSKVFLAILALISLLFLILYFRDFANQKRNEVFKRLSLQVLTHEFRTPVSSLVLATEQLTKSMQRLSHQDQDLITSISADIFKLQRIVEISQNYLQSTNGKIQFNLHRIPSLNEWLTDFISNQWPQVKMELLPKDQEAVTDIFWLKFVLTSLLENAFHHGRSPVNLKIQSNTKGISFTIEDAGICSFERLQEMTQPFVKSSKSQGMGLGLNIVEFIVREWGPDLYFKNQPTRFTLLLKEKV